MEAYKLILLPNQLRFINLNFILKINQNIQNYKRFKILSASS